MTSGGAQELLAALHDVEGPSHLIAVLWTWVERRRTDLGALARTTAQIRRDVDARTHLERDLPTTVAEELAMLRQVLPDATTDTDAVFAAAHSLAAIGLAVETDGAPAWLFGVTPTPGWDGTGAYVVHRRSGWMSAVVGEEQRTSPPAAKEQPSLTGLAPALHVVPVECDGLSLLNGAALRAVADTEAAREWDRWDARWQERHCGLATDGSGDPGVRVVAASLGDWAGIAWRGITDDPDISVGNVIAGTQDDETDEDGCTRVRAAVIAAADADADVLLLPELCASPAMLIALREALRSTGTDGPIATVVGVHHRKLGPVPHPSTAPVSRFVNEAVVLGPTGIELARHQKLSAASFHSITEDIQVGGDITVLDTPAGGLVTVTCLDLFLKGKTTRLQTLPGQLLLVPSLSETVNGHKGTAASIAHALWGIVVVCNRWFADVLGDAHSPELRRSFACLAFYGEVELDDRGEGVLAYVPPPPRHRHR